MATERVGQIIWERTIDRDAVRRRRNRFLTWYCLPVSALALVVGVLVDPMSALGILIVFGLFGLLIGTWVFLHGRNLRANPALFRNGDLLHVGGRTEVPISRVVRWTTYPRQMGMSIATPSGAVSSGETRVHVVGFWLEIEHPDGSVGPDECELLWPLLSDADQDSLRSTLDPLLPGRWVPLESFRPARS